MSPATVTTPSTWWDPRALTLDVPARFGIRRQDLIEDVGTESLEADLRQYQQWQRAHEEALDEGARPSLAVRTVTEWSRRAGAGRESEEARASETAPAHVDAAGAEPDVEVTFVDAASGVARPAGPRFGTLVHAVLATVPLDAERRAIEESAALQARILGATHEETVAATALVEAALADPLLGRARRAWQIGRCRRETPIAAVEPDGTVLEGVLDLAFEEDDGWTVVDLKTDAELAGSLPRYRRQVAAYARIVARATGRPVKAVLMRV